MDINTNNIDNQKENLLKNIDVEPDSLSMNHYLSNVKVYKSPLEEVSKNLLISNIDTKALKNFHNVSESYIKALTPLTDYYKSVINFSSIKPTIEKAIKVTMISNNIDFSNFTKEISKSFIVDENYSNIVENIKNLTYSSLIGTKFIEKMDFNIPNIGMESSVRISNSLKELLRTYPVKIDINIPSLEESLDQTYVNFSKPSEMTIFILDNTENAESITVEEAEIIDSLIESKDENEIVEIHKKILERFEIDNIKLISYVLLISFVILSYSNPKIREFLLETISEILLAPSIMDMCNRTKKILKPKDNETSKNDKIDKE